MKFILPQRGGHGRMPRAKCGVHCDGANVWLVITAAAMAEMGWSPGDKVALGYDAEAGDFGLQRHAQGYVITAANKATPSQSVRVTFGLSAAKALGVPAIPKTKTVDASHRKAGDTLILSNPFAAPRAQFIARGKWNAANAV